MVAGHALVNVTFPVGKILQMLHGGYMSFGHQTGITHVVGVVEERILFTNKKRSGKPQSLTNLQNDIIFSKYDSPELSIMNSFSSKNSFCRDSLYTIPVPGRFRRAVVMFSVHSTRVEGVVSYSKTLFKPCG